MDLHATPYVWATMMNGSVTVKGRTADINVDLNDLWNLAKLSEIPKELFAFMGSFEARYDRFSIFSDFYIYSRPMQPVLPAGSCPLRSEATELVRVNEMTQRAWEPTFGSRIRSLHPVFFLGMVRTI